MNIRGYKMDTLGTTLKADVKIVQKEGKMFVRVIDVGPGLGASDEGFEPGYIPRTLLINSRGNPKTPVVSTMGEFNTHVVLGLAKQPWIVTSPDELISSDPASRIRDRTIALASTVLRVNEPFTTALEKLTGNTIITDPFNFYTAEYFKVIWYSLMQRYMSEEKKPNFIFWNTLDSEELPDEVLQNLNPDSKGYIIKNADGTLGSANDVYFAPNKSELKNKLHELKEHNSEHSAVDSKNYIIEQVYDSPKTISGLGEVNATGRVFLTVTHNPEDDVIGITIADAHWIIPKSSSQVIAGDTTCIRRTPMTDTEKDLLRTELSTTYGRVLKALFQENLLSIFPDVPGVQKIASNVASDKAQPFIDSLYLSMFRISNKPKLDSKDEKAILYHFMHTLFMMVTAPSGYGFQLYHLARGSLQLLPDSYNRTTVITCTEKGPLIDAIVTISTLHTLECIALLLTKHEDLFAGRQKTVMTRIFGEQHQPLNPIDILKKKKHELSAIIDQKILTYLSLKYPSIFNAVMSLENAFKLSLTHELWDVTRLMLCTHRVALCKLELTDIQRTQLDAQLLAANIEVSSQADLYAQSLQVERDARAVSASAQSRGSVARPIRTSASVATASDTTSETGASRKEWTIQEIGNELNRLLQSKDNAQLKTGKKQPTKWFLRGKKEVATAVYQRLQTLIPSPADSGCEITFGTVAEKARKFEGEHCVAINITNPAQLANQLCLVPKPGPSACLQM
jgi:hypothetical protein